MLLYLALHRDPNQNRVRLKGEYVHDVRFPCDAVYFPDCPFDLILYNAQKMVLILFIWTTDIDNSAFKPNAHIGNRPDFAIWNRVDISIIVGQCKIVGV